MLALLAFLCFVAAAVLSCTRWARFALTLLAVGLALVVLPNVDLD